ncbi:TetR/AcrR family transcriptional regulator [Rathayibacter sp. VKM Ac-2801]|uniref:TetR/AcrR family transcriptional regulator n=1 Tax=Rathayibacter sp. VKM Ac-2801 TaxID=2609255 RepID=UPI0013202064|nr:TetR/AcrR family transcriptional regulator [Rathayibacter sp. VKM Ac-2801]QHC70762.1 TetR family transcriptional regulator [Rathayibacter sp. VKM Ac-2801]
MATKREQAERTKQAVLEAAAEEFDVNGYIGGSIGSIAARLGLTKGSVAYHFTSKANLAAAIVEEEIAQIDQIVESIRARGLAGIDALVVALHDIILRADTNTTFRAAFRLNREHSVIDIELPRPHLLWMAHTERFLHEAQQRGEVSATLDTTTANRAVAAMFLGEYQLTHELDTEGDRNAGFIAMWEYLLSSFGADPREVLSRNFDV